MIPDIGIFQTAWNSGKHIKNVAKALLEMKVSDDVREKVQQILAEAGDLHEKLFDVQNKLLELQSNNEALRNELNEVNSWNENEAKHKIVTTSGGATVRLYEEGSTKYFACPACFVKKEIQILQDLRNYTGTYKCPACEATFYIKPLQPQQPRKVERYDPFKDF